MNDSSQKKVIAGQKLFGMQVIDGKGGMVGNVRDVGVDAAEKQLVLFVTTRVKTEVEIPWSNVQSIEDVILLNKTVDLPLGPSTAPSSTPVVPSPPPIAQAPTPRIVICPSCKSGAPERAKFCPKCGGNLK